MTSHRMKSTRRARKSVAKAPAKTAARKSTPKSKSARKRTVPARRASSTPAKRPAARDESAAADKKPRAEKRVRDKFTMPAGEYDTYFIKIDNCKFKHKVVPGDTMILKMELLNPIRRGICEMRGTVYVGNKIVTEADLMAQLVKRS